ncbi:hypothetical protein AMAG_13515 [Allomyces macrogynus ATCC 38327]|uniref:Uncharacterized protein n=1 Tax=Allomyces macrogynus (strain ATCC 38327) TaxID=578462 RepID=A0A0L0T2A4_ALLM3|nr:hypothetical protein AMAG_13515 [Allomyces macrogynus ATCC 38327]|eukprot:KNE68876.1 hypothetical protein AMAG_13515 [Allomyces macrogynus ATCC 38327]
MPMPAMHPGRALPARLPHTHHHDNHLDGEDGRVKNQFAKAVTTFCSLNLASLVMDPSSAEEQWTLDALMDQVEDPATLSATRFLVNETALITTTIIDQSLPSQFDARALLAALVTATFPSISVPESPESDDDPDQEAAYLIDAARSLTMALVNLLSCSRTQPDRSVLASFARASTAYVSALTNWKCARTHHLVADLVAHACEANLLWITARPRLAELGGRPAREYLDGLRTRIQLIHNRLVRVLGTKSAADKVLAQARRDDGIEFDLLRDDVEELLGGGAGATDSVCIGDEDDYCAPLDMTDDDNDEARPISARNLQFAHDLHLGPVPETASVTVLRNRVRSTLRTTFIAHAAEQSTPSDRTPPYLIDVLATACDHIAAATPHPESTRAQLDAVIYITSPHTDALDAARAVVHAIRTVCAPARNTDVDHVATLIESDLVAGAFAAADLAESVRADFAQCAAAALRPHVARHVVAWERVAFERAVDDGRVPLKLPRTRTWLLAAAVAASATTGATSFATVWNAAFADLLITASDPLRLPETFPYDTARIAHLADRAHRLAIAAAVATHARARNKAADARAAASYFLTTGTASDPEGDVPRELVARCIARSDPVYRVVSRRVRESLLAGLVAGGQGARVARGLECVENEVRQWVESAVVLAAHNKRVYAPWYDRILGEIVKV